MFFKSYLPLIKSTYPNVFLRLTNKNSISGLYRKTIIPKLIIGLHGAGFANFCFCEPKTKVVEFRGHTTGSLFENLALSNNLNYKSISCESIGVNYNNQFGHIKVPIEKLKESII